MKYICPVCGYPNLEDEPKNHEICPSCGTEFGYDDFLRSHESLRNEWFAKGAKWFLEGYEPKDWNPYLQLMNLQTKVTINSESLTRDSTKDLIDDSTFESATIGKHIKAEKDRTIQDSWSFIQGRSINGHTVTA